NQGTATPRVGQEDFGHVVTVPQACPQVSGRTRSHFRPAPTALTTGHRKENYGCFNFENVHRLLSVHRVPRGSPHGHPETADRLLYGNGRTARTVVGHRT